MPLPPPAHLGEMKGLLTYEPDAGLSELLPPGEVQLWMSMAGVNSIFPSPWPGVDVLEDHEVHVIIRSAGHEGDSAPSAVSVLIRTCRGALKSSPVRRRDIDALAHWVLDALRAVEDELKSAAIALDQAIAIDIERLVAETLQALSEENGILRRELEAARIRIGFLEGQLHALSEAQATGRRRITKAMLGTVAAVLLAAAGGATEGFVVTTASRSHEEGQAIRLARECLRIQEQIGDTAG